MTPVQALELFAKNQDSRVLIVLCSRFDPYGGRFANFVVVVRDKCTIATADLTVGHPNAGNTTDVDVRSGVAAVYIRPTTRNAEVTHLCAKADTGVIAVAVVPLSLIHI